MLDLHLKCVSKTGTDFPAGPQHISTTLRRQFIVFSMYVRRSDQARRIQINGLESRP